MVRNDLNSRLQELRHSVDPAVDLHAQDVGAIDPLSGLLIEGLHLLLFPGVYRDPCVLMGYSIPAKADLSGKRIAVLHDTACDAVVTKYQQDEENGLVVVPFAAYYDMLVALRAGSVDAACMPRTVALTHQEKAMVLSGYALGTVDYHVIGTREEKDLLSLIDSQLLKWANDGTLRKWYEAYDLGMSDGHS